MLPFDPFGTLASEAAKLIAQGWVAIMLSMWNCGLWLLRLVMNFMDAFLTPDLSETGPAADLYRTTFWIGGALTLVLALVQLGVAAVRRDGKSVAQLLIGVAQFAIVWVAIVTYAVVLVAAAGGLTTALMEALLNVTTWSTWQPWTPFDVKDVTDAVLATLLGMMGLFLLLAAIGHFFIMIVRGAALIVLVATSPIAAAGLVGELGRGWFWKTFRWLHAAAFTPPMVVLVMGIGVQLAQGVAVGGASTVETSVGTAFPAVMLICASVVSPLALFKLLSFVDPGTATGAAMRAGLVASGGLQGLLAGNRATGTGAASATTGEGRSAGEANAEDTQAARINHTTGGGGGAGGRSYDGSRTRPTDPGGNNAGAGGFLGAVGSGLATGIGAVTGAGTAAVAIGADQSNQAGVGHNSYYPDYTAGGHGPRPHPTQTGAHPTTSAGQPGGQPANSAAGHAGDPGGDPCPDDPDGGGVGGGPVPVAALPMPAAGPGWSGPHGAVAPTPVSPDTPASHP